MDFFAPVVDDPYDWGSRSLAVHLLAWPRDRLSLGLAAEVLRGGDDACQAAGVHLAGGHSIDDSEPKYGLAVTGMAPVNRILRNDAGVVGTPLTLTKPLGFGVLNNRHKAIGERFQHAIDMMTTLNRAMPPALRWRLAWSVQLTSPASAPRPLVQAEPCKWRVRGHRCDRRAAPGRYTRVAGRRVFARRQSAQPRLGPAMLTV